MDANQKFNLIVDGLQEVLGEIELINILQTRNLKLYWGTATTGRPHIGYLMPLIKLCHFLKADCEVTILFANIHAYLDAMKSTWEQLEYRSQYYEELIKQVLLVLGAPLDKLKFVRGSEFQLSPEYTINVYKIMSKISLHDAKKAGAEVVKQSSNPKMSSLLYPGLQALDEEFLKVDAQFGGIDQRKIFMLAEKYMPQLSYRKRIHLMNPMIKSFSNNGQEKMSCSDINSKIDFLSTEKQIKKKINKTFCEEGNIEGGFIQFVELVVFPILKLKSENLVINRSEEYGGKVIYNHYKILEGDLISKELHPGDLKKGISDFLINLLGPVRTYFETDDMKHVIEMAYKN